MKQSFNIQATGAAFDTLSSRLYSNPILAVVRELSTNANDAHIEAGVDKPFQLHIPTENERFFSIRDFGNGIPEDLIYNIYTTFFMSTKTEDENQTGYFGLGSKSPYSLVDKYKVISYCEGRKKTYMMEKSNGLPTVEKIEDVPTSEESGLEIYFDYKDGNYSRFMREAKDFFKGTSFMPTINFPEDFEWEEFAKDRTFYSNDTIEIGNDSYRTYVSVNVAGVKFNVDIDDVKGHSDDLDKCFRRAGVEKINIMAGKSDVTLTPSRETLHYDDKTIDFIYNKITSAVNDYYQEIRNNFDNLDYPEMINLINHQSWDQQLNDRCKEKIKNTFYEKSLFCYHGGRGAHIDTVNPTRPGGTDSWRRSDKTYLVDFNGIKSTVKQSVVDNFLAGKTFDEDGKCTSTSFLNVIKSLDTNANYNVLFPKNYKDANNLKAAIELAGEKVVVVKWSDVCELKKSEGEKRKVGFKTRATYLKTASSGFNNFWGNNPDLEADEIGVIIPEDYSNSKMERLCKIMDIIEPGYRLAIRPCKESVFKTMKSKGYQTLAEYVESKCKEHMSLIENEIKATRIQQALHRNFNYGFDADVFAALNDSKYDELAAVDPNFAMARKLYTQENCERSCRNCFEELGSGLNIPNYSFNFDDFPMMQYLGSIYNQEHARNAFDYMLMYSKSEEYAEKKIDKQIKSA